MKYSFLDMFGLFYFFFKSKLMYNKNVRIIKGTPRFLRLGNIKFGKNFTAGADFRAECIFPSSKINFGDNVKINDYVHIGARYIVNIGDNVLVGSRVTIIDHQHGKYSGFGKHSEPGQTVDERTLTGSSVTIKNNVWLGEGCVVMPGVTIGENSIIGANSVVTHDINSNTIAVGIPSKPIKQYNKDTKQWELLKK